MGLKNLLTSFFLISCMILLPAAAFGKRDQPPPDLFDSDGIQQTAKKTVPKKALKGRYRRVNAHSELLPLDSLTLNLFDDVVVTAVRDRLIDRVKNHTTWIGHVESEQDSEVFLTVRGKTMAGTVRIGKAIYEIEPQGPNAHAVAQIDPDNTPKHSHSKTIEDFIAAGGEADTTAVPATSALVTGAATPGTIIDLMVVYTPQAKANASGQAGIEVKITNAVAQANQAYLNSKIDLQLNLVHLAEIGYSETGNMSTSLTHLAGATDGYMDAIHALRNQYGADQVVLVTADANYCGIAYVMTKASNYFAPYAFSVVHDDSRYGCLAGHTLAHELGHNQGSQHDRENANTPGAFDYSYGYRLCQNGGFLTIMSYGCSGAGRVSYFSSPNVTLSNGLATGTATEDNARSISNTKAIVAGFRATSAITVPQAPANVVASAVSDNEISVAWSDNSTNETGFRLERSVDGANWTEFVVTTANTANFTDSGLAPATRYHYRVRAYNGNGNSLYSNIASATTENDSSCITNAPVLTLSPATQVSKAGAELIYEIGLANQDSDTCGISAFTVTANDGAVLGTYLLKPGDTVLQTWTTQAPATDGSHNKTLTASALGHASVTGAATVRVDAIAPSVPGNLSAFIKRRTQVALSWRASIDSGSGLKHYVIKRNNTVIASTTGTGYTDRPGVGGFTYVVEAHDKVGNFSTSAGASISVSSSFSSR